MGRMKILPASDSNHDFYSAGAPGPNRKRNGFDLEFHANHMAVLGQQ